MAARFQHGDPHVVVGVIDAGIATVPGSRGQDRQPLDRRGDDDRARISRATDDVRTRHRGRLDDRRKRQRRPRDRRVRRRRARDRRPRRHQQHVQRSVDRGRVDEARLARRPHRQRRLRRQDSVRPGAPWTRSTPRRRRACCSSRPAATRPPTSSRPRHLQPAGGSRSCAASPSAPRTSTDAVRASRTGATTFRSWRRVRTRAPPPESSWRFRLLRPVSGPRLSHVGRRERHPLRVPGRNVVRGAEVAGIAAPIWAAKAGTDELPGRRHSQAVRDRATRPPGERATMAVGVLDAGAALELATSAATAWAATPNTGEAACSALEGDEPATWPTEEEPDDPCRPTSPPSWATRIST